MISYLGCPELCHHDVIAGLLSDMLTGGLIDQLLHQNCSVPHTDMRLTWWCQSGLLGATVAVREEIGQVRAGALLWV